MLIRILLASIVLMHTFTVSSEELLTSNVIAPRIIGGTDVQSVYPWMVSLQSKAAYEYFGKATTNGHFCGGVLIAADWVLTAAHCLTDYRVQDIKFVVGDLSFADNTEAAAHDGEWMLRHHEYDDLRLINDMAIVKLATASANTPIQLQSYADFNLLTDSDVLRVMGWGLTEEGNANSIPEDLQEVDVYYQTDTTCDRLYGDQGIDGYWDTALCAGVPNGGKDSCQGDSGGPLVRNIGNNQWELVGLVSWGYKCGESGYFGVYAEVPHFSIWIDERQTGISITGMDKIGFIGLGYSNSEPLTIVNLSDQNASIEQILSDSNRYTMNDQYIGTGVTASGGQTDIQVIATGHSSGEANDALTLNFTKADQSQQSASILLNSKVLLPISSNGLGVDWTFFSGTKQDTEHATPWYTSADATKGTVMRSGNIDDSERSVLMTYITGSDQARYLKFDAKVDADDFDVLSVLTYENPASGTVVRSSLWDDYTVELADGQNHVLFIYVKDYIGTQGTDAAYLTNIRVCSNKILESTCEQSADLFNEEGLVSAEEEVDENSGKSGNPDTFQETKETKSTGFGSLGYFVITMLIGLARRKNLKAL